MKTQNKSQTEQAHIAVVKTYFDSLAKGDLNTLGSLFAEEVVWHQPGTGTLSGVYKGKDAVFSLFGQFMQISEGTFKIDSVNAIMANGNLVSAILSFSAKKKGGAEINMKGIDLMKVENGKITEVYLFSEDQQVEDQFWS